MRVFQVNAGVTATLKNLTITKGVGGKGADPILHGGGIYNQGTLTVTGSTLSNNWGGIRNEGGATLTVNDSHFTDNWVSFWGGDSMYAQGGAILNHGTLTVTGSTFTGNHGDGIAAIGAVSNSGTATITTSTFDSNTAIVGGGALGNFGTMTIGSSIFTNNSGGLAFLLSGGGAILNKVDPDGSLTISGSTFSNNTAGTTYEGTSAPASGGAILSQGALSVATSTFQGNTAPFVSGGSDTYGGAIVAVGSDTGVVSITNNTFLENSALLGGALAAYGTNVSLTNNTFVLNTATTGGAGGTLWLDGSGSLSNNLLVKGTTGGNCTFNTGSSFTATNNLADDDTCGTGFTNSASINLGTLTGSPAYYPLQTGSSAIDAGDDAYCPATDQRGLPRPQGLHCDVGSYEVVSPVLYAESGGLTSGGCGSWANACELHYALDVSVSGQDIWAAAGTYKPDTTSLANPREAYFQLKDGVAIYGGFAGTETTRDQRNWTTNLTILSGDLADDDGANFANNGENSYHVVMGATGATLDGFTISGGNANASNPYDRGGGILNNVANPTLSNLIISGNWANIGGGIYNDDASPMLTNVTFSGNAASYSGGGMQNYTNSRPTLSDVTFYSNSAQYGGGMFNNASSPSLTDVTFSENRAITQYGGGMHNESNSSPTLTNVTFHRNSAAGYGGGMYNIGASPTLINVTFNSNWTTASSSFGGGLFNWGSSPLLTNVTFSGNSTPWNSGGGGGMANFASSNPQVRNSILWGNSGLNGPQVFNSSSSAPTLINSVIPGCPSYSTCTNLITADPRLGALGNYGGNTETRPLLPGSSAIDATSSNCPATDQRGVTRSTPACDIGAFESQGFTLTPTGGDGQSTVINTAFPTALGLTVTANDPLEPVNAGVVTFTGPAFGASTNPATNTATISGGAVSRSVTANGTAGSYTVTASMAGASSVDFSLINLATYMVSYDANNADNGTAPANQTKTQGVDLTLATNTGSLVKTGYTLSGWNTLSDGKGTHYDLGATYSTDAALALFAEWTADTYIVSFDAQGGTPDPSPILVTYGSAYGTLPTVTRSGFTFNGWYDASSGGNLIANTTIVSTVSNHTLYAQWADIAAPSVDTFTVTTPTNNLNIPITDFTASDNIAVTGYLITESSTPPLATDSGWSGTAPTAYTVASEGAYTLYPWAKDAAGNVSAVFASPRTVDVDTTAPVITITEPNTDPAQSKTITASASGGTLEMSIPTDDTTCGGALTFVAYASQTFTHESDNGTRVCYRAVDTAGNTSYSLSNAIAGIDTTSPSLASITRQTPLTELTNADTLIFWVAISEDVLNVGMGDFAVNGSTTATVSAVNAVDAQTYDVTVSGGDLASFTGTVGLNLAGMQDITDLAGNPLRSDEPATDETYDVDHGAIEVVLNGGVVGLPGTVEIIDEGSYTAHFTSLKITFTADAYNPTGDDDPEDVTNSANYQLITTGADGEFTSEGCGAISPDDILIPIDPVTYSNIDGFVATVTVNGGTPLPSGKYRLYICGSTSITDLAGNHLNNGSDEVRSFTITDPASEPQTGGSGASTLPLTGFRHGQVTPLPEQPASKAYAATDMLLEIPAIKQKLSIVGVPQTENGWDVTWLGRSAGWLNGTAFPTWNGNSVITAHVWDSQNQPGPFANLKNLKHGDQVRVHAWGQVYTYEVRENYRTSPQNIRKVMKHEELSWLTLVTCEDYKLLWNSYSGRRVVRAVLVDVK